MTGPGSIEPAEGKEKRQTRPIKLAASPGGQGPQVGAALMGRDGVLSGNLQKSSVFLQIHAVLCAALTAPSLTK